VPVVREGGVETLEDWVTATCADVGREARAGSGELLEGHEG
jgi:hypothetical protein